MISRDAFVKIMDGLRDYWDSVDDIKELLGVQFEVNFLTDLFDTVINALTYDVGDSLEHHEEPWLYYFGFTLDWGRNAKATNSVTLDGEVWPLTDAGKLYDLLVELKKRDEKSLRGNKNG